MVKSITYDYAKKFGTYAYQNRAQIAARLGQLLSQQAGKAPAASPAAALKNTRLKTYMDRTYEKKCGVEVKQFQSASTAAAPNTTLATLISPFQGIAQGLTDADRIASSIEVKRLRLRLNLTGHATLLSRVRIIVLKQGAMGGSVPAVGEVLTTTTDIKSFYALNKDLQFSILKDVTFEMTPLSTNDANSQKTWYYDYKPKGCHLIRYLQSSAVGSIPEMIYGNINIKIMHDGGAPTGSFMFNAEWVDS